jgi:thiol-disulfide isomerase/thioredoxin
MNGRRLRIHAASQRFPYRGWIIVLTVIGFALVGCTSTPKKGKTSNPDPVTNPGQPFWQTTPNTERTSGPTANVPGPNLGTTSIPTTEDPTGSGILAGRVVDGFNRAAGVALVQVQAADGRNEPARDIETSPQGHFVVRGLVPGRSYRLVARSKAGMRPLAGEAFARAPDAKILISVSEDYVAPNITPSPNNNTNGPTVTPPVAELGPPRAAGDFYPAAPESIAGTDAAAMPRANIPPGLPDTGAIAVPRFSTATGPVPDCLVANGRILTLRLQDPEGRVWDFSQRQGRLILLDFWGSWCTPCLRSMPELIRLQQAYRTQGLEVIGIACEKESAAENVARVQRVRRLMPTINYRILMAGEPASDPVRAQFRPSAYPFLALLDSDGTILWRGVGGDQISDVESIIRDRLSR